MSRGHPQQPHAPSCLCSSCHLSSKLFPRGPNDRIILPAIRPTPTSPLASPTDFIRRFDPVNGAFKGLPDGRQKLMTESSVELRAKDQLVQELLDRWAPMNVANPDHDISSSLALSKTPSVRWRELGRSELLTGLRMKHVKASSSDFKDNAQLNKGKLANSPLLQSSSDDERSAFEEALDAAFFPEEKISGTIGPRSSPSEGLPQKILVYQNLYLFISAAASHHNSRMRSLLETHYETMSAPDSVLALLKCRESRSALLQMSSDLGVADDPKLRTALFEDEQRVATLLLAIIESKSDKEAVLLLDGDSAQDFLDVIQNVLDRGFLIKQEDASKARKMLLQLSEACDKLPSSLFITGVSERDEEPTFGGGFANVYRALYGGKTVALKRLQTFHRGADLRRIRLQFCREALVWQSLTHPHIVPLIGIDRESFPMSLCMVSPWMEHGTVLKYLEGHGRRNVDKLLSEIAHGLQYLHSHNVVHGDLRGANILITQDWSACLTDFGLTSLTDATVASTSHRAGSLRWMAPELINPDRFGLRFRRTPASDVYAFGSVCLELYTGLAPFPELSETAAMFKIIEGELPDRPLTMSQTLWEYVTNYLGLFPETRPDVEVVVRNMAGIRAQRTEQ